jgi:putative tryptophan/tyrosine transport system substrate-binding protein
VIAICPRDGWVTLALKPLVSEVVALGLDALVTIGSPLSLAAKRASTQIPLVFFITFDPVDISLVSNLARPGGNVTGVTGLVTDEIFAKHLELATKIVPSVRASQFCSRPSRLALAEPKMHWRQRRSFCT